MRKVILILICLIPQIVFSQSGWVWNHPKPQGHNIRIVEFFNENTGYLFGEYGTILKTNTGGASWEIVKNDLGNLPITAKVFNDNLMYLLENRKAVKKSINGGKNWTTIYTQSMATINDLYFLSHDTGFVVGYYSNNPYKGLILKTFDGGNTWDTTLTDTLVSYNGIKFINSQTGFISSGSSILKTTNRGNTWYEVGQGTSFQLMKISFPNPNTGYITGYIVNAPAALYKTTNEGESWFLTNTAISNNVGGFDFINETTGFAGYWGLSKTTNGGYNWDCFETGGYYVTDFHFFGGGKVLGAGYLGDIIKSNDNFNSYTSVSYRVTDETLKDSYLIDENTGYCINSNEVLQTVNGGNNWTVIRNSDVGETYNSIYFLNNLTGFIGSKKNTSGFMHTSKIYKTSNGSDTWQTVFTGNLDYCDILDINFDQLNSVGFAVGRGNILKTTDNGNTWVDKTPLNSTQETFYSVEVKGERVHVTGTTSKVYYSSNGGNNWSNFSPISGPEGFRKIKFTDQNNGLMFGYGDKVLRTTTGGTSSVAWELITPLQNTYLLYNDVFFLNDNTGYFACEGNYSVLKTTDGGNIWIPQLGGDGLSFNSINFVNPNTGFIFGNSGYIMKTTTGGTVGFTNISLEIPSSFRLHQNYPNPFNPSTKIRFDVPKNKEFVKLIIYDIAGREITRLVNQELSPGIYEYEFDGRGLSSGMYFYRLSAIGGTNSFIETKKMVLVK